MRDDLMMFEDLLDAMPGKMPVKKASEKITDREKKMPDVMTLSRKYDWLFVIKTDMKVSDDISGKLEEMREYLDGALSKNRCVKEYELGLIYNMSEHLEKSGITAEGNNVVTVPDQRIYQMLEKRESSDDTDFMFVTIGMNLALTFKGLLRLMGAMNLHYSEPSYSFIMSTLTVTKTESNPLVENGQRYTIIEPNAVTCYLTDVYTNEPGSENDNWWRVKIFNDLLNAFVFMMPDKKQAVVDGMREFRPENYAKWAIEQMRDAQKYYLSKINKTGNGTERNKKILLKKSVEETFTSTGLKNIEAVRDCLIYYKDIEDHRSEILYVYSSYVSIQNIVDIIRNQDIKAQFAEMRALSYYGERLATLVLSLGIIICTGRPYSVCVVLPGIETGKFSDFIEYVDRLKMIFGEFPEDDWRYLVNIVPKTLK